MEERMRDILESHNLGFKHFGKLIGSSEGTLYKYMQRDGRMKDSTKLKIERGLRVVEKYDLVAPKLAGKEYLYSWYEGVYDLHARNVGKFDRKFEEFYSREIHSI